MQKANKNNSKKKKEAKVEYKRTLGNYLLQYNTSWTNTKKAHKSQKYKS